jgi:hypothetical protein
VDSCEIYGSDGVISFSFFGERLTWQNREGQFELPFNNPENVQLPMIQGAVDYFLDKRENPCPAYEAIEGMRVMDHFTDLAKHKTSEKQL